MVDTVKVGVGLDYESEQPWVWTDDDVEPMCEDVSGWFAVDVPAALVERFKAANEELHAAIEAVHEAAGFDSGDRRLATLCGAYKGDQVTINPRKTWWDDCDRCGWSKEAHDDAQ